MSDDPLPTDKQRIRLHDMVAMAFVEIRLLGWGGRAQQASDLANAFHNIPREIYGWGLWSIGITRGMLQEYQDKYHHEPYPGRTNYTGIFDSIFPPGAASHPPQQSDDPGHSIYRFTMPAQRIELWEHVGLGLILAWPSGIILTNQTGGTACLAPELEGVFIPLRNDCTEKERGFVSPENELYDYFTGPKWRGTGATNGIDSDDANFIDSTLGKTNLFPTIRVNRDKLHESHEAWVHVTVDGDEPCDPPLFSGFAPYPRPGILTWQNSD